MKVGVPGQAVRVGGTVGGSVRGLPRCQPGGLVRCRPVCQPVGVLRGLPVCEPVGVLRGLPVCLRLGLLLGLLLGLTGCFDSLVSSPCAAGYAWIDGRCAVVPDAGSGSGSVDCTAPELACHGTCLDLRADPDNCGACDRACASGICVAGHCQGTLAGHIVAIGHDYQRHHASMARVLGNAIALAAAADVGVARWRGSSSLTSSTGTSLAITSSMISIGRPWHVEVLPASPPAFLPLGIEVLVIEAQGGDGAATEAAAVPWATAIDHLLQRGGVVIVLHGALGTSHRFAQGAGLYTVEAPAETVGELALIADRSDALAQQVVSPYLAEASSVVFPGISSPVIVTASGGALVFHQTRY